MTITSLVFSLLLMINGNTYISAQDFPDLVECMKRGAHDTVNTNHTFTCIPSPNQPKGTDESDPRH